MKTTILILVLTLITIIVTAQSKSISYIESSLGLSYPDWDGGKTELEFSDMNADGFIDIVSVGDHGCPYINTSQHGIMVWFGDGTGSWSVQMTGDFGYGGIAVGDVNNDGLLDVGYGIHHNYSGTDLGNQLIEVALGDGTGTNWTAWDDGLATNGETYGMFGSDFADVDNDGDLDIGSISFGAGAGVHVYINQFDGSWEQSFGFLNGNSNMRLVFGDINNDGNADMVTAHQYGTVYFGDGAGGFTNADGNLPGSLYGGPSLGDINNDGGKDLAFAFNGSVQVWIWDNTEEIWIDYSGSLPAYGSYQETQLYDMNADGNMDIAAYGDGTFTLWLGDGTGTWNLETQFTTTGISDCKAFRVGGDADHNGFPDITLVAEGGSWPSYQNHMKFYKEISVPDNLTISTIFPKGHEVFNENSVQFIDWISAVPDNVASLVKLEYSIYGLNGPWSVIADNLPNNGRYQWNIPQANSSNCYIKYTVWTETLVTTTFTSSPFIIIGENITINIPEDYPTIQEGINASSNGDIVLVQPGTYVENINFNGKNITVASLFLTTQDETYISQTIIDGNQNGSVVSFISGEEWSAKIIGFTITNGFAQMSASFPGGGGIKCVNSSPTIENNIIKENNCDLYIHGGGIYCEKSSSHILNNAIYYNEGAYYGGGIFVSDTSAVLIKGNIIYNNITASGYGVAYGGGICCGGNASNNLIENNTICNNIVDFGDGGGIYSNTLNTCVVNTIIWNNSPDEIAETLTITYSDIQGGWAGTGNIDVDPLFADPANGDYHLTWANFPIPDETKSPCIDAGNPDPIYYDPDGTVADIGAYYFDQFQVTQEITLKQGYSFMSSRIIPSNPDMLIVMDSVLNENLDYVRNSQGQTLRKIGPIWVNGIGNWIVTEGYLVKMFVDDSLIIGGDAVDPVTPVPVATGFQFVSYFPETPMDALIAFSTIIGDDLDYIRNSLGEVLRKIGPNWVNGIGDCQPGEGYLVKMYSEGILIYPGSSFTCGDPFTDPRNDQVYNTTQIDEQCWMAENLNIGEMINGFEEMTDNGVIEKYCFDNDPANCEAYGGLYQWNEMMEYVSDSATQGICPEGWYLPTDFEWKILEGTVDSQYPVGNSIWNNYGYRGFDAGLNLKSTTGWNAGGNGSGLYGYEAPPGGYRNSIGNFSGQTSYGNFWSSSEYSSSTAWYRSLNYGMNGVVRNFGNRGDGFSVRCLQDNSKIHTDGRNPFNNLSIKYKNRANNLSDPKTKNIEAVHFGFKGGNAADPVYTIYAEGLEISDEIAAFDGEKMVGALRINSQNAFENELPVFSTLINGKGYEEGNLIRFKVWSENKFLSADFTMETIYDAYVSDVYPEGDGKYSVVNITKGAIENVEEIISVYPNPTKGKIIVENLGGFKNLQGLEITDIAGKIILQLEIKNQKSKMEIDLSWLEKGVYFISLIGKDFKEVKKIVFR